MFEQASRKKTLQGGSYYLMDGCKMTVSVHHILDGSLDWELHLNLMSDQIPTNANLNC